MTVEKAIKGERFLNENGECIPKTEADDINRLNIEERLAYGGIGLLFGISSCVIFYTFIGLPCGL